MPRTMRRPATSRGASSPHRPPAPRPRDRHVLRAAVGRRPEPEKVRAEAFVSYVRALPAEADSIGAIRAHFADDLHALFEALLGERRHDLDNGHP